MDTAGARARQTTLNVEKGISRIPGAQKLAAAQAPTNWISNSGAAFAAGEGVDVLTEPLHYQNKNNLLLLMRVILI